MGEKRRYDAVRAERRIEVAIGCVADHSEAQWDEILYVVCAAHHDDIATRLDRETRDVEIQVGDRGSHDAVEPEPQVRRTVWVEPLHGEIFRGKRRRVRRLAGHHDLAIGPDGNCRDFVSQEAEDIG